MSIFSIFNDNSSVQITPVDKKRWKVVIIYGVGFSFLADMLLDDLFYTLPFMPHYIINDYRQHKMISDSFNQTMFNLIDKIDTINILKGYILSLLIGLLLGCFLKFRLIFGALIVLSPIIIIYLSKLFLSFILYIDYHEIIISILHVTGFITSAILGIVLRKTVIQGKDIE